MLYIKKVGIAINLNLQKHHQKPHLVRGCLLAHTVEVHKSRYSSKYLTHASREYQRTSSYQKWKCQLTILGYEKQLNDWMRLIYHPLANTHVCYRLDRLLISTSPHGQMPRAVRWQILVPLGEVRPRSYHLKQMRTSSDTCQRAQSEQVHAIQCVRRQT